MDIVALYKRYGNIDLEPVGDRWRACCPFHSEQKPSFTVYPTGDFHCFGCGAHGNIDTLKDGKEDQHSFLTAPGDIPNKEIFNFLLIKRSLENKLANKLEDKKFRIKCLSYDAFDKLCIDMNFMIADPFRNTLDNLVTFRKKFKKIIKFIQKSA